MNPDQLRAHADRIRSSQVLGRSDLMQRLFDFLVACSQEDRAPKEIELAIEVFGKDAQFEVTRDAMVRVYMHKLRRKLEDYYAGVGRNELERLTIPRGEYRLVMETAAEAKTQDDTNDTEPKAKDLAADLTPAEASNDATARRFAWQPIAAAVVIALLAVNLFVWFVAGDSPRGDLRSVRQQSVWQPILNDDKPVYLVLGDYYIFGELDAHSPSEPESVRRLVREFNINSRNDLEQLFKDRPETATRYMDLALSYLPVSSAYALSNIVPIVQSSAKPRALQVVMASELTPAMIRSSHVVYVGLISGMGILRDIAFSGSQFKIGDTYDELIDRKTNQMYVSQSSVSINDSTRYRDYGYFATFDGPNKNRIVILAGTRDVALMHIAEAVSHSDSLLTLAERSKNASNFEALYAVDAIDRMNLDGKLILADKLDTANIWASNASVAAAHVVQALH